MASTDAIPVPRKNTAFRLYFRINDSGGDPAAGVTSLAAEISKDGAAFGASTNTPVEVGNGVYFIDLTATEMNADSVVVRVTSSAKETQAYIYPEAEGDYRIDPNTVRDAILSDSTAFAGANVDATISSRLASADITLAAGAVTVGTNNDKTGYSISGTITTLDGLNDPTAASIADAVWDEARADHTSAGSFGQGVASVQGSVTGNVDGNVGGNVTGSVGSVSGVSFPTNFGDLSITASTGLVDITQTAADKAWSTTTRTLTAGTKDSEIDAIKAKTDSLAFTVANVVDANIQYVNDVEVGGTGAEGNEWGPA